MSAHTTDHYHVYEKEKIEARQQRMSHPKHATYQSIGGRPTTFHSDVDVVLSLKDEMYKEFMFKFFIQLGSKNNNLSNQVEKDAAQEVIVKLKARSKIGGSAVRFFKPESRYSVKTFVEVDEISALEKITADIYRRMESAKAWLIGGNEDDYADQRADHRAKLRRNLKPAPQAPFNETSSKKRKIEGKTPESLPFLNNVEVADIIATEEQRAKRRKIEKPDDPQSWQPEEVINFFRGLYVHKWDEWAKVSSMIKTKNEQRVKSYAMKLEAKYPELVKFFTKEGNNINITTKYKRNKKWGHSKKSNGGTNLSHVRNNNASVSTRSFTKFTGTGRITTKPNVVICLGDYIVDTQAEPWVLKLSSERKRPAGCLPECFDPSIRPTIPTSIQHIFIPGNHVYARWMDKNDPGSYGTWYPGIIHLSKLATIQDTEYQRLVGAPNLLYHVKFDDGAESKDLGADDIMMQDHYLAWLKDLEQYYLLPVPKDIRSTRLTKNQRVYAKWIDPTDPELNGCWMPGKIHSHKTWQGKDGDKITFRYTYHIYFNNGDEDDDVLDVLPKDIYLSLLAEKIEISGNNLRFSGMSGFDLIAEASKLSSPMKTKSMINIIDEGKNVSGAESDEDSLVDELRCYDVLEPRPPSPSNVARISSTPSPDVHYGIYMKSKPWY